MLDTLSDGSDGTKIIRENRDETVTPSRIYTALVLSRRARRVSHRHAQGASGFGCERARETADEQMSICKLRGTGTCISMWFHA
jgi:hypothetical protein